MTPSFKALIFDLDGTLVDSSKVVRRVMEAWACKNNVPWQSVLDVFEGGRTEDTIALVAPHLCAKSEAAEIESIERTTLEGIVPILGAEKFVGDLGSHVWAIATSSSILNAKPKLEHCRMPIPRVLVAAESVSLGKPHPEPFLAAARELSLEPKDCLVFEDADNGVKSALAAGCSVVIVGRSCLMEHPNIIARIDSFADASVTPSGDIKVGTTVIQIASRRA